MFYLILLDGTTVYNNMLRDELIIKQTKMLPFNDDSFELIDDVSGAYILLNRKHQVLSVGYSKMFQAREKLSQIYNGNEMLGVKYFQFFETKSNTDAITLYEKLLTYYNPEYK